MSPEAPWARTPSGDRTGDRLALHDAQIRADDIDCLSASANGSILGDRHEAQGVASILGGQAASLPVTAIKSMLGDLLGAAGARQPVALFRWRFPLAGTFLPRS
jgi:3-oxoacyl-(acyl-carrier-protein) synthase